MISISVSPSALVAILAALAICLLCAAVAGASIYHVARGGKLPPLVPDFLLRRAKSEDKPAPPQTPPVMPRQRA